jgi:hypothetical protein
VEKTKSKYVELFLSPTKARRQEGKDTQIAPTAMQDLSSLKLMRQRYLQEEGGLWLA